MKKGIKQALKTMLPAEVKYRVFHQASRAHYGLQAADYCNWAIYRKWDKNDAVYYNEIKPAIFSEYELFTSDDQVYY